MTRQRSTAERALRRTEHPSQIPAIERAIAAATCRLLLAHDNEPLSAHFFSRSVVACRCCWVWPESVIRQMAKSPNSKASGPTNQNDSPGHRLGLKQIAIPSDRSLYLFICAQDLVDPQKIFEITGECFHTLSINVQNRPAVAHATLDWLSLASDPASEIPFLRNARFLGVALGLKEHEIAALEFMSLVTFSDPLKSALATITVRSMSSAIRVVAKCIGSQRSALLPLFSSSSPLVQSEIHRGLDSEVSTLEDALCIQNPSILEKLGEPHADEQSFIASFLAPSAPTGLATSDFPHLAEFGEMATATLKHARQQNISGLNVFLYGPPGTGKTEYARLLAQSAGLVLYEVPFTAQSGASLGPGQRLGLLMLTFRALQNRPDTAILLDEAEDIFEPPSKGDVRHSNRLSKAWLNNFLETVPVPVLWTSNSISHMDPAVIRRLALVRKVDYPPQAVRGQLARSYLSALSLDASDIEAISRLSRLTPASLSLTGRIVALAGPADQSQALRWVQGHLRSTRAAQGLDSAPIVSTSVTPFDVRFINTSGGPELGDLLQFMREEPKMSLCLYGGPGTGKTEFARHLAQQLARELVTRTGADLLSKWLGETEQNIARMFEECAQSPSDTVLLLDEADTFLRNRQHATRRWELSQTNEFLARMESFPGTFVCTTNLFEEIDPAVLRRFQFRMRFAALRTDQARNMFEVSFGCDAPPMLESTRNLVPADFANVKRQLRVMRNSKAATEIVEMLRLESRTRQGHSDGGDRSMGFLATLEQ